MPEGKSRLRGGAVENRSIARRMTLSLVATACVVSFIAVTTAYRVVARMERTGLQQRADQTLAYLVSTLDSPLWAIDRQQIKTIGAAVSHDEHIVALTIRDENGAAIYELDRQAEDGSVARAAKIFHRRNGEDRLIGDVALAVAAAPAGAESQRLLASSLATIALILLAIIGVAMYYIRAALAQPVKRLNEVVAAFAAGNYKVSGNAMPYVEFQPFSRALVDMAAVIAGQMSEQKRADEERKAHLHFSVSMDRVHRAIQGSDDLEQSMREILDVVLDVFGCERASLFYPTDPDAPFWRVPMERTRPEFPGVGGAHPMDVPMTPDVAKICRALLHASGPLKLGTGTDLPTSTYGDLAAGQAGLAMAIFPKQGKPWGFAIQQCGGPRQWTRDEERLFEEIGRRLADALTSLLSRRDLERSEAELLRVNRVLRESLLDSVSAVAATVEMRDPYTAGHQRRVAQLATAIARELGLPEPQIEGVNLACVVHDVGKIKVPAETLSKPGVLNPLEVALIREHSRSGYEILKGISFPWPIADIVLQHHERLDGSGYPQGLKGDEILIEAQILAVADVVEAMMSDRPYRPGLGIEAALNEITGKRGTVFSAAIVDACVALFREKGFGLVA